MIKPTIAFLPALFLILTCPFSSFANVDGLAFRASSKGYEARSAAIDGAEDFSIEAWITIDPACPEGACIVDKWGTGSQIGFRLETGPGQSIRFITTAPGICQSEAKIPGDHPAQVVGVFSSRGTLAALYIDGKRVAALPTATRRFDSARVEVPLRIGADQDGNHPFTGTISQVAFFGKAMKDAEVTERFEKRAATPDLIADWILPADAGATIAPAIGKAPLTTPLSIISSASGPGGEMTLWYSRPAREWVEALATGNGRLGAMVYGGVNQELLQLNEDTIWSGGPYDPANAAAPEALKRARALIFSGKQKEADDLLKASAMGTPSGQASYQTLGNLLLDFGDDRTPVTDYRRSLDLDSAIATTTYKRGDTTFTRQVFCSAPDRAIVVRLTADKPGRISFGASMNSPHKSAKSEASDGTLTMTGTGEKHESQPGEVKFTAMVRAMNEGGSVSSEASSLRIDKANAVTLVVSCGTNFVNYHDLTGDPDAIAKKDLDALSHASFDTLRDRHLADYQPLFHRVSLALGSAAASPLPTDERIKHFSEGKDPQLAALFYQFGRYLLISSSRPGGQPANLQGLWNQSLSAPWGGKYTININTEENYWPSETTNLSECAEPLFQLIRDISQTGANTAKVMYQANGWVCHHNTDIWRATAPIDWPSVGMWPTGGAWLCTHLWEHYQFTGDQKFLADSYPILKGSCQFFLDTLVEEPTHHWLVTCPSISPEHGGVVAGPSMDMQILRDLFSQTAQASEILNVDPDFRKQILATREKLAPPQIGKYGQLQEWLQDLDKEKDPYRHLSHLYCVFPSNQIGASSPELFAAAKKSLIGRGDGATGWSLAWKINLWARMLDGDHSYLLLTHLLNNPKMGPGGGGGTYPNLFDAHPPFQIDGNFAATSGITEMLLQSQEGFLRLLPALPSAWPEGTITGLKARGGFTVDLSWKQGRLSKAVIHSKLGSTCGIRSTDPITVQHGNEAVAIQAETGSLYKFETKADETYQIMEGSR